MGKIDKSIYYDLNRINGYNKLFNFILGARGIGKTYGLKKYVLNKYQRDGSQFIYLRRTADDTTTSANTFFKDLIKNREFGEHMEFDNHDGKFYMYDKRFVDDDDFDKEDYVCGYYQALSKATNIKSVAYPYVDTVIYDEFIADVGQWKIKNEPHHFLEFYNTVSRLRKGNDVKAYFLSNALTITNDYFRYFNIEIDEKTPYGFYTVGEEIVVEIAKSEKYSQEFKKTRFGALIKGTDYESYAVDNEFLHDNRNFVGERPEGTRYYFTIIYGVEFGVWITKNFDYMFISEVSDKQFPRRFAIRNVDHKNGTLFSERIKSNEFLNDLNNYYNRGRVIFETINVKNNILEIMNKR